LLVWAIFRVVEGELQMRGWLQKIWETVRRRPAPTATAAAGARGEQAAADFLAARQGFAIVTRNWHRPRDRRDEIDLVCRDGEVLVFVEVKARAEGALVGRGFRRLDRTQAPRAAAGGARLPAALAHAPRTFRFDVVEVTLSPRLPPQVMHYENVPLFPKGYHVARQSGSLDDLAGGDL
jgi:putative endonuclease